jgi:hypothetical protein
VKIQKTIAHLANSDLCATTTAAVPALRVELALLANIVLAAAFPPQGATQPGAECA